MSNTTPDWLSQGATPAPTNTSAPDWLTQGATLANPEAEQDGAFMRGLKTAGQSAKITGQLAAQDAAGVAQSTKEAELYRQENPGTKEGDELAKAWDSGDGVMGGVANVAGEFAKDYREAKGFWGGVKATGANLEAMRQGIVSQLGNSIAPMVGMVAGGAAGAAAGSAAPVVGNVAGGLAGGWAGASIGNTLVEGGGQVQDALQKAGIDPLDTAAVEKFIAENGNQILGQSAIKSGVIGAVDTATAGAGGKLLKAPVSAAMNRAFAALGIDMADKVAVNAAIKSGEIAKRVAADPIYQASQKGLSKLAREGAVAALDPAGEFTGEYVGQGVATGDWDTKNAALEALSSVGQSGIMYAGQKGYQYATNPLRGSGTANQNSGTATQAAPGQPLQLGNSPDPLIQFRDGTVARQSEIDAHLASLSEDERSDFAAQIMGYAPQQAETAAPVDTTFNQPTPPARIDRAALARQGAYPVEPTPAPVLDTRRLSEKLGLSSNRGGLEAAAAMAVDSGASPISQAVNTNAFQQVGINGTQTQEAQQAVAGQSQGAGAQERVAAAPKIRAVKLKDGTTAHVNEADLTSGASLLRTFTADGKPRAVRLPASNIAPAAPKVVLQNRNRATPASIAQMNAIASKPDFLRTGASNTMDNGAPIVFGDLPQKVAIGRAQMVADGNGQRVPTQYAVVEAQDLITSNHADGSPVAEYANGVDGKLRAVAGNGRAAGLKAAWQRGTAGQYGKELVQDAPNLGMAPDVLAQFEAPVLVRVMDAADVTPDMGDRSNVQAGLQMSAVEQASNDAQRLNLRDMEFDELGNPTAQTVMRFMQGMPVQERGNMLDSQGRATSQLLDRIRAAAFKQAYMSDSLVELAAQSADPEAKNIINGLAIVAGDMAQLAGTGDFDIRQAVTDAANMAVTAARTGQSLAQYLQTRQIDENPETVVVMQFMAQNVRSAKRIADGLRAWAELAQDQIAIARQNAEQDTMFGDTPTLSRRELFERLNNDNLTEIEQQQLIEQQRRAELAEQGTQRPSAERAGKADGASDGAESRGTEPTNAQDAGREQADFALEQQTPEQIRAQEEAQAQAARDKAKEDAQAAEAERKAVERQEVTQRSEAAANDFQLGQSAEDNLSGQGDIFAQPQEATPEAPPKTLKEGLERVRAKKAAEKKAAEKAERASNEFIPAPNGGLDYGEITPAMGKVMSRQAGKIRLQQGVQNADGTGWGLAHIEANHGEQIRALGFKDAQEFVAKIAGDMQQVWQVAGNSQLLLTVNDGRKDVMFIRLEPASEGDFYRVNTAFPVRQADYEERKGMKKLWDWREPNTATTGQQPAFATTASAAPETVSSQGSSNARGQSFASVSGGQDTGKPATDEGSFLAEGETTKTSTGRQTTPFPKWRHSTGRVTDAHMKAVNVWLLDNARLEAQARGDDFNERNFAHVLKNPSNIQQADKDGAELYLFNRLHGQAVSQEPVKNEKPAAARDSAESNTETATAVNQPSRPDKWRGNKLQAAKVARDLGLKLDIPKISILDLVRAIDAHDAKANGQEVVVAPAKPKKNTPFAVGNTPSDTEKVTVRDGTVFLDKYEAIDYESGEPVTVPKGSTRGDVVKALRDAGAISKNTKVFGASGEQANDLAFSRNTGRQNDGIEGVRDLVVLHNLRTKPKGATTSTIRHAASRAYGKLLERLEAKGLVHVAQTEEDALQAAAKARAAKTGQSVGEALEGLRQSVQNSIAVWHGTPHRGIEKTGFKLNKIGTGAGAQAYGWGIYFSSAREVAEGYRKDLAASVYVDGKPLLVANQQQAQGTTGDSYTDDLLLAHHGDIDAAIANERKNGADADAIEKLESLRGRVYASNKGQLYEAHIPSRKLLDWYRPLNKHSEWIKEALSPIVRIFAEDLELSHKDVMKWTAKEFYEHLAGNYTPQGASEILLKEGGIKGLRYRQTGLSEGSGTYNYVIWDEALLTPEAAQIDAKFSKDGAIEGFFDRQTGKSFLVADGLTEETAPATLMHEVGIHMAADGSMQGVFNRAAMLVKNSKDEFMNRVRDRMEAAGETSAEEAAAYIVTEYEKDRTNAPASIKQFMKDFMAAVRAWLFRNGFTQVVKEGSLTPADISAIARANARSLANGANRADTAQNSRQNLAFSEVGSVDGAALQRQFDETARAYGGQDAYAKAKADGKTKLNYRQWVQVRTPNFKAWFGDWENDPANASKVVDSETGEPLVVYHGGTVGNVFSSDYAGSGGGREKAFFFTPDLRQAKDYAGTGSIKEVFLDLKSPVETDVQLDPDEVSQAKDSGNDGYLVIEDGLVEESEIAVFSPTQIKSATGNSGNFDGANPDIRFSHNPSTQAAQNTADSRASTAAQNPSNPSQVWAAIEGMFEGVGGLRQRLDAGTTVVRSADELPQQFQQAAKDAQAQGFYDDKSKRIYLVADRIEAGQEKAVWLHEVFHKRGSELLGDTVMARLHGAVQRWSTRKVGSVERQVYDAAHARAKADGNYEAEFLAYAIEEAVNRGVQPDLRGNATKAGYWLGKVMEAFNAALGKLTGRAAVPNITAAELVDIAYGAAGLEVERNGPPTRLETMPQTELTLEELGGGLENIVRETESGKRIINADVEAQLRRIMRPEQFRADGSFGERTNRKLNEIIQNTRVKVGETKQEQERRYLSAAMKAWAHVIRDAHKNAHMVYRAMPVAEFNNEDNPLIHKSKSYNGRQSSEYRLVLVDGKPAFARKSNHWGAFTTNIYEGSEDAKRLGLENDTNDQFGRVGWKSHNWELEGGNVNARNSQAGYVLLEDLVKAAQAQSSAETTGDAAPNEDDAFFGIDQTQTPEFKRWFGDSKVVDSDGKPLVVYHGTNADFSTFDISKAGQTDSGWYGRGFYFTPNTNWMFAEDAAASRGGAANVMPVYLKISNPMYAYAHAEQGSDLVSSAKERGFDGIIVRYDPGHEREYEIAEVIAFEPNQIKSATGNSGDFDPSNPDIRFSRAAPTVGAGVWQSPEPTKFDQWTYLLQDKQIDTKRVLNAIKSTGQQVDDAQDVYLQETLYHGRTAKRVKDFAEQEERPLMELMRDKGLSLGQVEEYLHARHAPEANKALAERNPSAEVIAANLKAAQAAGDVGEAAKWRNAKPYTGTEEDRLALSGMSDAEAAAVMAALTPEQRTNLQAAAEMVDAIVAKTRQTFVEYGLETQETVDAWGKAWAHYVPLMREQPEDTGMAGMGTGQGFSVKGKEVKGRTGSTKKVVDILANINMQRERAIVRGEKNRVATALLGLVKANPNKDFWRVATAGEVPSSKVVDERTGLVRTQIDPLYKSRDNALVVKVDGQEQVILFNEDNARAMRMASALKNMDAANLEGMLGNVASVTRYLAAVNTQYNPIFGIVNMVRDFQEAAINLQATPLAGKQKQVLGQALTAVWQVGKELRAQREGKTTGSEWGKLWEDFQAHGGQTGYRDMFTNSADRSRALQALLQPDAWADTKWGKFFSANGTLKAPMEFVRRTALRPLLDLLSDYNEAIENGVRLSAYKTAIEQGMSRERAAELAKNLTVNFNRKGQVAQQVGALYAFFNASVQGTARMGQTLFNMEPGQPKTMRLSPLGKKIVGGAVLLGSVQALLLAAAGFGEDEPPEFIRERNLVIPNPLADKGYTTIPMPLGYHVLANLGRIPTEYALGGFKDGAKRAVSIVDVLADIYNPLGGGGLSMQTISPTVLDPFAALAENKDFSGRPIAKESLNKTTPGHALGRDTSSFLANGLAQVINYATGGTEYTRGELSPTPDQIDYLIGQVFGGVGREASKVSQTAQALATGDDLPWHKVPLIGRFYGSADTPAAVQSAYYATMDDVRRHAAEVKGLRNDGRGQEAVAYMQENPQAGMHFAANAAERQVKKLRERISDLKEQGAPRDAVRAVETQMVEVMQRFSAAVENRKKLVSA